MAVIVSDRKLKYYWPVYLLIAVPLGLVLLFNYYPIINGFVHIFYRWDGSRVEEFIGLGNITKMIHDMDLWRSFLIVLLFVASSLVKMILPIITAVILHHIANERASYFYRIGFVIPMVVPAVVAILMWKYFYEPNAGFLNQLLRNLGFLGMNNTIQWLSSKYLVLVSLIFQGFPWVGAFGVLIYLAGLNNIPNEVYEAADIDGAGPLRIFSSIELPLITTQIRINLVLMVISTIQGWQNVYLFLGESGGPGGIATVPGLLVFREAFAEGMFGYGCAVGFLLFLIILTLTGINNKFVRTKK